MPNLYVTPTEIKMAMPDAIRSTTSTYDALLRQLAERMSRLVDIHCGRLFYPQYAVRCFHGDGGTELWVPDLLSITLIEYSKDNGYTYTAMTSADYIATVAGDVNSKRSYTQIVANVNAGAAISYFPAGQNSIRITGVWGFAEDRDEAWEDSGVDLAVNYTAGGATLTVVDITVNDRWAIAAAFQAGKLLKLDDEFLEINAVTAVEGGNDTITVVGARNGTTAANHTTSDSVYLWRVAEPVKQACLIQSVRAMERGLQGYGDIRATPEIGVLLYTKGMDTEATKLLEGYRWYGEG